MHSRGTIKNIGALDVWNLIKTGFHASRFETDICTHTHMYIGKDSSQVQVFMAPYYEERTEF